MVDAIVSPLLEQLISIATQEAREEVRLVTGVENEVKKLTTNLQAIQAVMVDAERRQVREETVRLWLDQLKDASYDIEDVLDEWKTARLKLQIEGDENALVPQKRVCSSLTSPCFSFKQVSERRDIARKIKEINENLDCIAQEKEKFNFDVNVVKDSIEKPERVQSTSLIDEFEVCGREDEKRKLINMLCKSNKKPQGLQIISIVGMGGIGKTTLAQLVYNNSRVTKNFEKSIWVCVSEPFDVLRIAKAIVEGLDESILGFGEFQSYLRKIYLSIAGKKFFLVLDDVWNEDYYKWEPFYTCLKNGHPDSKVLITTRKESVAHMMESTNIIFIDMLTNDECWGLFKRFAFIGRPDEERRKLEGLGRKIVGKCKGLPLAAKTIGSLLHFKKTREEWQHILDSEMWKLEEVERGVLAPLLLSYYDLPSMVRQCFLYCAVFPKEHNIQRNELIYLWMAQGYLGAEQNKDLERVGQNYFDILSSRSFFQEVEKDDYDVITKCKMHDTIHDFAQYLSKNECFSLKINGPEASSMNSFHEKARHSMIVYNRGALFPVSICKFKKMRTLLICSRDFDFLWSDNNVLQKLFVEFPYLRALDISGGYTWCGESMINEISMEVGKLTHLRYLNLQSQNIQKLPETLCNLYNLQTLDISWCQYLQELPQGMGKLINLRHLVNYMTESLGYMPKGMETLTCLRTLKHFVVGEGGHGSKACRLESLNSFNLVGDLNISGLENVSDVGEAKKLQFKSMENILHLFLHFGYSKGERTNAEDEILDELQPHSFLESFRKKKIYGYRDKEGGRTNAEDEILLDKLRPHPYLESLKIYGYRGNNVSPSWMMSLTNLRVLDLRQCQNCVHLPPLGKLPSLERLNLWRIHSVKRVGNEFLGIESEYGLSSSSSVIIFPKLQYLQINQMHELEEWDYKRTWTEEKDITVMPILSYLKIYSCPKLKVLPDHVLQSTTLQKLEIKDCYFLEKETPVLVEEEDISHS